LVVEKEERSVLAAFIMAVVIPASLEI